MALEGFTWGCPTLPTAADLAGMDDVMVAGEATMSQQAADLAPGTHVEYRSREPYLIGGWFRAQIVQVLAHTDRCANTAEMHQHSSCHYGCSCPFAAEVQSPNSMRLFAY